MFTLCWSTLMCFSWWTIRLSTTSAGITLDVEHPTIGANSVRRLLQDIQARFRRMAATRECAMPLNEDRRTCLHGLSVLISWFVFVCVLILLFVFVVCLWVLVGLADYGLFRFMIVVDLFCLFVVWMCVSLVVCDVLWCDVCAYCVCFDIKRGLLVVCCSLFVFGLLWLICRYLFCVCCCVVFGGSGALPLT